MLQEILFTIAMAGMIFGAGYFFGLGFMAAAAMFRKWDRE